MEQNLPERRRIVVDGSNIATEGRTLPSLAQLDEAIRAFLEEYRGFTSSDVTVVVDASFGHRIDPSEVSAFDQAIEHGEMIAPPAGAIGRGDGFILRIAEKSGALVLSNDSFQEFHAERPWLFEPGRLIGGKPVPGVGWIFTPRTPVRGARSRSVTARSKRGQATEAGRELPTEDVSEQSTQDRVPSRRSRGARGRASAATGAAEATPADDGVGPTTQGLVAGESAEAKPAKAIKPTKAAKAAKAAKTTKAEKATTKATKAAKTTKAAKATKPTKATKATATTKATKATKASKATKATKATKAGKTAKASAATKAGEATKPTKSAKAAKSAEATKATKASRGSSEAGGTASGRNTRQPDPTSDNDGNHSAPEALNDPMTFLTFVADHPVGSTFDGTVVSFTSHGAHVDVGGMLCHVPLRGLAQPPPKKARQVVAKGETRPFQLVSLDAARRRAELAVPGVGG